MSELLEVTLELEDGESVVVKFRSLNLVPIGLVRQTRRDEQEQVWRTLEWAVDEESLSVFDEIPASKMMDLLVEMQKASNADLGKSKGSSTSSTSTARRSKQTSSDSDSD